MFSTPRRFPPLLFLSFLVAGTVLSCLPLRAQSQGGIRLDVIGVYSTGKFAESAAEISAYDPETKRLFMINALAAKVDVLSLANPVVPALLFQMDASAYGAGINSVAVHNGVVAIAVEDDDKQANGSVVFYTTAGVYINHVEVGALPDMLTFTPDGTKVLVANEGEPNGSYTDDPEGTVSIIDLSAGVANITQDDVRTAGFTAFNNATLDPSIRIFGPNATVAQDLEPEYIAVSPDSKTAWVTLQEGNAIAVIDIASATVTSIRGLGFKDHSIAGNGLDASDRDNMINIRPWPVRGMYQPDAIAAYTAGGQTYLVMANEGDARDYSAFAEEKRVKDLKLDATAFPASGNYRADANLGRLTVTSTLGDANGDGFYEELYVFGARSFSIRTTTASLVWDSGDEFERITAQQFPADFNATNDENQSRDNRSDNKGPEPEGVTLGQIGDSMYAFIGLERIGGIMVYNITNPQSPTFVQYINPRNFAATNMALAGELGPEGLLFIPRDQSPNKRDLLVVSNEISGSVTVYQITPQLTPGSAVALREYQLRTTPAIGMYRNEGELYDMYYEGGMSGMDRVLGRENEFMMITDRGPNVEATSHPLAGGQTTLLFPFPGYAPKIFHMKAEGDSLRILSSTTLKRPDGTPASGLPNPNDAGGTGEIAWSNVSPMVLAPDAWGIDSEGIVEGNNNDYWLCEEYGATVWNIEKGTGRVINRYTPFGASAHNIAIPPAFGKRRPNRGFEGIAITPGGKVYAMLQGPLYNPDAATGNASRLHRLLEIDPATGTMRTFAYEHDAALGQIRSSDWKIGDMVAVNDHEFLVLEHAERNGWNYKNIYKIDLTGATPITGENFNGKTFEQLNDAAGALVHGIVPVTKTLFFDLLENNWHPQHDKPEGITILNDSTFAVVNDNDYGVNSPNADGVIVKTGKTTTLYVYTLPQSRKMDYVAPRRLLTENINFGRTGQMKRIGTTAKNTSNIDALTATVTGVSGNGGASYLLLQPGTTTPAPLTQTIAANAAINFDVAFGVQGVSAAGRRTARWSIQHSGTNSPSYVEFTGYFASLTAQQGTSDLLAPDAKLLLGDINVNAVGQSAILARTISVGPDSVLPADAPVLVTSYSISGPDAALFSVAGLQAGMALADSRAVTISFNGGGTMPGVKRATLTINHTAANGPAVTIPLEARVGRSVLTAPTLVSLPSVRQGQMYTSMYENVALIPLTEGAFANVTMTGAPQLFGVDASSMELLTSNGRVYIAGTYDSDGNVVVGGDGDLANPANWLNVPATVMQNRPLLLAVRMKQPVAGMPVGTYSAQIVVAGSGNSGAENTVTSTLVGRVEADPNAAPGIVDFGTVPVGMTLERTLTLRSANAGWVTMMIPANNNFTFAGGVKMTSIYLPGGGVPVNTDLAFAPQAGGAQQALLSMTGVVTGDMTLKGTGEAPSLSSIRVQYNGTTVNTMNFGTVTVGQTSTKNMTIVNNNAGPVWISMISRSGSTPTQFSVGTASATMIPGNGGSVTLPVSFVPTSLSPVAKSAVVNIAFTGAGTVSFAVTGTASATSQPQGTLVLSPASWNFGTATTTKTFTLTNNLSTPVTLTAALITAGNRFSVVDAPATFPRTLAANGGTTTVTVQYTQGSGPAAGALLLYTPGVAVYPTATLQGGNYARAGSDGAQETAVAGFPALELDGVRPNPVTSAAEIRFRLHRPVASAVLRVYDVLGNQVAAFDGGSLASGVHALRFDASAHSAGVYYYTLEADGESRSGMMVVTK